MLCQAHLQGGRWEAEYPDLKVNIKCRRHRRRCNPPWLSSCLLLMSVASDGVSVGKQRPNPFNLISFGIPVLVSLLSWTEAATNPYPFQVLGQACDEGTWLFRPVFLHILSVFSWTSPSVPTNMFLYSIFVILRLLKIMERKKLAF